LPEKFKQSKEWKYPVVLAPKKNCIVRSHRYGSFKRRGFKEKTFQNSLENLLKNYFEISGDIRLNTGSDTRPFEPDIAIIDLKTDLNLRIDIEIDEPYAGISRKPTHLKNEDYLRDLYFIERGWTIIRFTEYQIHTNEVACLKFVVEIIKSINPNIQISSFLSTNLQIEEQWDLVQAQKWEKTKWREEYLQHEFKVTPELSETVERTLNSQEIEEERKVKHTEFAVREIPKRYNHNLENAHKRDERIKFYPEEHLYEIDNIPAQSASTIVSCFFPEFDSIYWSHLKAPGLGMTPEEVDAMWKINGKDARDKGTFLHEEIEKFYAKDNYSQTEEFQQFLNFHSEHADLKPFRTEWKIFDETFLIAGTIDFISQNKNGFFDLYDWKRSEKVVNKYTGAPITSNKWQSGLGIMAHIEDTSYNRYCLQQNIYKHILENRYNLKVERMFLVVMHPKLDNYYKVEVPKMDEEIKYILNSLNSK